MFHLEPFLSRLLLFFVFLFQVMDIFNLSVPQHYHLCEGSLLTLFSHFFLHMTFEKELAINSH